MPRFHSEVLGPPKAPPKGPGNMPAFDSRAPVNEQKEALEVVIISMKMGRTNGQQLNVMEHYDYRGIYIVNGFFLSEEWSYYL